MYYEFERYPDLFGTYLEVSFLILTDMHLPYTWGFRLGTSPLFIISLLFLLRWIVTGFVECLENPDTIYVIDRPLAHGTKVQCCLAHPLSVSLYLGMPWSVIEGAITASGTVPSSHGCVYVSVIDITDQTWNALITLHPELATDGVTCTKSYVTSPQAPPRSEEEIIDGFARSTC
jgi:hypothetical protein